MKLSKMLVCCTNLSASLMCKIEESYHTTNMKGEKKILLKTKKMQTFIFTVIIAKIYVMKEDMVNDSLLILNTNSKKSLRDFLLYSLDKFDSFIKCLQYDKKKKKQRFYKYKHYQTSSYVGLYLQMIKGTSNIRIHCHHCKGIRHLFIFRLESGREGQTNKFHKLPEGLSHNEKKLLFDQIFLKSQTSCLCLMRELMKNNSLYLFEKIDRFDKQK
ncbi:hypothetical protein RFI_25257 [Reticulomyxa filosa]|uniref:Uncharacterized protein n=1 Tax=Reticulomyxa filosa TaxID=46433 RepID=X6MGE0_RETFI|nr:hypothetical protein RFI_25257 [Reticulomyxa filosa]|eukprot:ETO12120.1 hypothetical protein RFI_25257 [Reticulomyxa filosa]